MKKLIPLLLLSLTWASLAQPPDSPVRVVMNGFVANNVIAGSVTAVATKSDILSLETTGFANLEKKTTMPLDALFWIASMTKPMAAVCVLQLQEAGKLSIEDSVKKHLPEFAGQWMVEARAKGKLTLKKPARAITIRDLLTHTSGLPNTNSPRPESTLAELVMSYSKTPLQFEPGSRWSYSNAGINVLGRIVEIVSDTPFADYLQARVLDPCGMKDTSFGLLPRKPSASPPVTGRIQKANCNQWKCTFSRAASPTASAHPTPPAASTPRRPMWWHFIK